MGVGDFPLRWGKEQWRIQGRDPGPPPPFISLFLDQTKARMAEKKTFWRPLPPPHLIGTEKITRVYVQSYNRAIPGFTSSSLLNGC